MTRLLVAERNRIRHAILADIPVVDYKTMIENKVLSLAVSRLPAAARHLWEDSVTRPLIHVHGLYLCYTDVQRRYIATAYVPGFKDEVEKLAEDDAVVELLALADAQNEKRNTLDRELRINLAAVGTHEEFAKRWPELAKYLPDRSEAKSGNLPATTALIDGLKAAGLPLDTEAVAA